MERKETVESSGPGNLYFRLSPSAYQGRKKRKTSRVRKRTEEPTYVLTSEAAMPSSDDMSGVEQQLSEFQPWEDILRIEGRLGTQLSIVDRLLRVLATGESADLPGIQVQLDNLVLDRDTKQDLSIQDHITQFQATLEGLQSYSADSGPMDEDLSNAIGGLTSALEAANRMERVHLGDALLTLSTLVAGLLTTVQVFQAKLNKQDNMRGTIEALQKELEEARIILAGKSEVEKLANDELDLVLETEEVILESTREATMKMSSLSDRLEADLKLQRELHGQETANYESMIEALRNEKDILMKSKEEEVVFVQSELASVNEKYSLAASRLSELDIEIVGKQHQIDDQNRTIEELSQQLAEQVKVSEDLQGKLSGLVKIGDEFSGAWSEMDRRMSGLLSELAALAPTH